MDHPLVKDGIDLQICKSCLYPSLSHVCVVWYLTQNDTNLNEGAGVQINPLQRNKTGSAGTMQNASILHKTLASFLKFYLAKQQKYNLVFRCMGTALYEIV